MMHKNRQWYVGQYTIRQAWRVARKLSRSTWTLCTGMQIGGVIFLNDATCEDGAGEYGAIDVATGRQFESITFSWCTPKEAMRHISQCLEAVRTRRWPVPEWMDPDSTAATDYRPHITHDRSHHCRLCA